MPLVEFKRDFPDREVRQFALLWLPAMAFAVSAWATFRGNGGVAALSAAAGLLCLTLGVIRPQSLRPPYRLWMTVSFPLGWLTAHLLVAIIYFLLITPIGIVLRAARRDPLALRFDREAQSYWTPRPTSTDRERYFRQF